MYVGESCFFKIFKAAIKGDSVTGKNVAKVDAGFKLAFKMLEVSFYIFLPFTALLLLLSFSCLL